MGIADLAGILPALPARPKRRIAILFALGALVAGAGCGGDDGPPPLQTEATGPTGLTGPTGATGATGAEGAAIDLEEARRNLEEAGFSVEEQGSEDLRQETGAETIEATGGYRVFEPASTADVVIQQFESPGDAEAVAESLETGAFATDIRGDVLLFAVEDQQALLDEVSAAATG